jgi:hypothetical protein
VIRDRYRIIPKCSIKGLCFCIISVLQAISEFDISDPPTWRDNVIEMSRSASRLLIRCYK